MSLPKALLCGQKHIITTQSYLRQERDVQELTNVQERQLSLWNSEYSFLSSIPSSMAKPCFWLSVLLLKFENSMSSIDDRIKCVCYQLSHLIFIKCCVLMCVHIHVSGRSNQGLICAGADFAELQVVPNSRLTFRDIMGRFKYKQKQYSVYSSHNPASVVINSWPLISLPLSFLLLLFWCVSLKEKDFLIKNLSCYHA